MSTGHRPGLAPCAALPVVRSEGALREAADASQTETVARQLCTASCPGCADVHCCLRYATGCKTQFSVRSCGWERCIFTSAINNNILVCWLDAIFPVDMEPSLVPEIEVFEDADRHLNLIISI